MSEMK